MKLEKNQSPNNVYLYKHLLLATKSRGEPGSELARDLVYTRDPDYNTICLVPTNPRVAFNIKLDSEFFFIIGENGDSKTVVKQGSLGYEYHRHEKIITSSGDVQIRDVLPVINQGVNQWCGNWLVLFVDNDNEKYIQIGLVENGQPTQVFNCPFLPEEDFIFEVKGKNIILANRYNNQRMLDINLGYYLRGLAVDVGRTTTMLQETKKYIFTKFE